MHPAHAVALHTRACCKLRIRFTSMGPARASGRIGGLVQVGVWFPRGGIVRTLGLFSRVRGTVLAGLVCHMSAVHSMIRPLVWS
jgi:hypothetical protein